MNILKMMKIMGLAAFGVGIVLLIVGITILVDARSSTDWPSSQGTIVTSKVVKSRDSEGDTTYSADVLYSYSVEGKTYKGYRISFPDPGSGSSSHAHNIVDRYPKGKEVLVHYRPDKPSKSVLEAGTNWISYLLPGGGLVFLLGGVIIFFVIVPRVKKLRRFASN